MFFFAVFFITKPGGGEGRLKAFLDYPLKKELPLMLMLQTYLCNAYACCLMYIICKYLYCYVCDQVLGRSKRSLTGLADTLLKFKMVDRDESNALDAEEISRYRQTTPNIINSSIRNHTLGNELMFPLGNIMILSLLS